MNEIEVTQEDLDGASWGRIFLCLSLEKAVRFWPDMGLSHPCIELRNVAKEHCERFEELDLNDTLGEKSRTDASLGLLRSALSQIAKYCGPVFASEFKTWARPIFTTNRHLITQPFLWTQILRAAGRKGEKALANLNVSPEKRQLLLSSIVVAIVRQRDIHQEVRRAEEESRSSWDARKFSEYSAGASPLDMVREAVLRWRFMQAWKEIGSVLSQSDFQELLSWAKVEGVAMGIRPALIEIPQY